MSEDHRRLQANADTELLAYHIDAPLPHAPDGFWVYTFVEKGRRVGTWDWARDEAGLEAIAEAYRTATSPDYVPEPWTNADLEEPMLRPPIRYLVERAMDDARPGPSPVVAPGPRLVPDDPGLTGEGADM